MRSFLLFIIIVLWGCSPAYKLNHLLKKYPQLSRVDTVKVKDSIFVKGSSKDSSFVFKGDTVTIENGRQEIKYFYNTTNHKNYITGRIRDSTIIRHIDVPVTKIIQSSPKGNDFWVWFLCGVSLTNVLFVLYLLSQRKKPD